MPADFSQRRERPGPRARWIVRSKYGCGSISEAVTKTTLVRTTPGTRVSAGHVPLHPVPGYLLVSSARRDPYVWLFYAQQPSRRHCCGRVLSVHIAFRPCYTLPARVFCLYVSPSPALLLILRGLSSHATGVLSSFSRIDVSCSSPCGCVHNLGTTRSEEEQPRVHAASGDPRSTPALPP
jgi:hypothetical protein